MDQKPTYKEEVLLTLKQTLTNALSTLDRLMVEDNPVLIRGEQTFKIGDVVEDKHCIIEGVEGVITAIDFKDKICIVNFTIGLGHYEFSRLKKVIKKEENILERGKEVLNSQNEEPKRKFKKGDTAIITGNRNRWHKTGTKVIIEGWFDDTCCYATDGTDSWTVPYSDMELVVADKLIIETQIQFDNKIKELRENLDATMKNFNQKLHDIIIGQ